MALNFCFKGHCMICRRDHQIITDTGFGLKICESCVEKINKIVLKEYDIYDYLSLYNLYKEGEELEPEVVEKLESVDKAKLWEKALNK